MRHDFSKLSRRAADVIGPPVIMAAGLWVVWLALLTVGCLSGCLAAESPADHTRKQKSPPPPPVIVDPEPPEESRNLELAVSAEASLVATLYELLGASGTLTVNPASPIVLRRPEATLTISPGSRLSYQLGPRGGSISFAEPRPTVSVQKWGLKLSPRLARLDLSTDNSGTAHVESGPLKFSRRFAISWDEDDESGLSPVAASDLPVMRMFTASWCVPCKSAYRALEGAAAAGTLPFRVERVPEPHPFRASLPYFEWRDIHGERFGIQGWNGLAELVRRWRLTSTSGPDVSSTSHNGPTWTFPGSTRAELIDHLRTHPNHRVEFTGRTLAGLSFAQLLALHSRHHNAVDGSRRRPRAAGT